MPLVCMLSGKVTNRGWGLGVGGVWGFPILIYQGGLVYLIYPGLSLCLSRSLWVTSLFGNLGSPPNCPTTKWCRSWTLGCHSLARIGTVHFAAHYNVISAKIGPRQKPPPWLKLKHSPLLLLLLFLLLLLNKWQKTCPFFSDVPYWRPNHRPG